MVRFGVLSELACHMPITALLGADQTKFFLCVLEDHSVGSCGGNWLGPAFGLASSRPKKECVEYIVRDVGYSYRFSVFNE